MTAIRRVGVLGGGLMGSGIAQVCALAGCQTVVREVSESLCEKSLANIGKSLAKAVEKGKITQEAKAALEHLSFITDISLLE